MSEGIQSPSTKMTPIATEIPPDSPPAPVRAPARSAEVSFLAIAHFVLGGLDVLGGLLLLFGAAFLGSIAQVVGRGDGLFARLFVVLAVASMVIGVVKSVIGFGVLQRRAWGRILALVLGGLSVVVVLASLSPPNLIGLILNAAYAGLVFIILLNPRYAAEFSSSAERGKASGLTAGGPAPEVVIQVRPAMGWPVLLTLVLTHSLCLLAGFLLYGRGERGTNNDPDVIEQHGNLVLYKKNEGAVNFLYPYASPPNIELTTEFGQVDWVTASVQIKDGTATGFKWKWNNDLQDAYKVRWHAKGFKAKKPPE